jgi:hypothetical protein
MPEWHDSGALCHHGGRPGGRSDSPVAEHSRPNLDSLREGAPVITVGRNDSCPCGSGKKYKQCCLAKDEAKAREARTKETAEAPAPAPADAPRTRPQARPGAEQPWKRANTRGFQKFSGPRKVGGGG